MKKAAFIFVPVIGLFGAGVLTAARFESTIQPNCYLGPLAVGNLTDAQALSQLQDWWNAKRTEQIDLVSWDRAEKGRTGQRHLKVRVDALGVVPDFVSSIAQLPRTDVLDKARAAVGGSPSTARFTIKFKDSGPADPRIAKFAEQLDRANPPRVFYSDGSFERIVGVAGIGLDRKELVRELPDVLQSGASSMQLPTAPKSLVTQDDLKKIDAVVSTFTTRFPVRKKDRNNNIRLAAGKINGLVLMPGQRFSFNTVVGKRTIEDGFKEAPVFVNGGHGMGVGGGICQVSSTLYNAALFADLKIIQRHNHSLPVAYVPLGRDATVDYGTLDLVVENDLPTPIALSSQYDPGRLTFRVLGQKDPSLKVVVSTGPVKSSDLQTKSVQDTKLPLGTQKVIEKGSRSRTVVTYRYVYRDGALVAKERLGQSYYKGSERVVALGSAPVALPQAPGIPSLLPSTH